MENIQIPITENGNVTLAAAGKYCDRNIDINVEVEGGGVETATLTFECRQSWSNSVAYVNEAQEPAVVTVTSGSRLQLTVVKNSFIRITALESILDATGAIEYFNGDLYFVSGDCTFTTGIDLM